MKVKLTKIEVILNTDEKSFDVNIAYGKCFDEGQFKYLEKEIEKINNEYVKKLEELAR